MSTRLEFSLFNSLLQICLARLVPFHLISLRTTKMHLYICSNMRWIIRTAAGGNEGPEVLLPQRIRNKGQKSLKNPVDNYWVFLYFLFPWNYAFFYSLNFFQFIFCKRDHFHVKDRFPFSYYYAFPSKFFSSLAKRFSAYYSTMYK